MIGPMPRFHWTGKLTTSSRWAHLQAGREYVVTEAFVDLDGSAHPRGERWTYLGHAYFPLHNGLSLFVSLEGTQEWHIRLVDDGSPQSVTSRLKELVVAADQR